MKIEGCVALVTGANRGLGRALVSALREAGAAKVYAAARDERKIARENGITPLALDITSAASVEAAAKKAEDVTLLVNNAGIMTSHGVLGATDASLEADFQTNVLGTLRVIRAFSTVIPEGGAIVNILSLLAHAPSPSLGGYSASKAAGHSITQALRAELKSKSIEVLAALPGLIDTDMVRQIPVPKTSPEDTAKGIVAGIARGDEEIYPDPRAEQLAALWNKSHKEFERMFASF